MSERMVYPEWLEIDEDTLAEEISGIEAVLRDSTEEYRQLYEEKHRLLEASPALRSILDADEPEALTKDEAKSLIRIIALDNRMREIADRAIFVYGRKNAYRFMRSIGMA
ncbi:MAG: DUF6664 family protein [bacterium]